MWALIVWSSAVFVPLLSDLGSEDWAEREAASRQASGAGLMALPAVWNAVDSKDAEVHRRADVIVAPYRPDWSVVAGCWIMSGDGVTQEMVEWLLAKPSRLVALTAAATRTGILTDYMPRPEYERDSVWPPMSMRVWNEVMWMQQMHRERVKTATKALRRPSP